jgi:hypothetical protein
MATDKDFRVKNGLVVAENISADGNISINGTSKIYVADSEIWDDGANFKLFGTNQTQYSALGQYGGHIFYTKDGGSNSTEVFKINHQGNITLGNNRDRTVSNSATAHDVAGKDLTISAGDTTAGTTDNIAGGDLILQGGQGKGTGAGGSITFQVADGGSTGSTLNSLSTAMTIADDGNVGIGITSPSILLDVDGVSGYGGELDTTNAGSATAAFVETKGVRLGKDSAGGQSAPIEFMASHWGVGYGFKVQNVDTGGGTDLIFYSRRSVSTWSEEMRITDDGKVGIGGVNPSEALEVAGSILLDYALAHRGESGSNRIIFTTNTQSFQTGGADRLVIDSSGDVTISGNLTVSGDTITANVGTLDVEDKNITLNKSTGDSSATANGAGITIQDAVSATEDATILWDATNDEFDFSHSVTIDGSLSATTKSFDIEHPTKEGMRLRHGSLEGPEHGVYVRGRLEGVFSVIDLPDYWTGLVDEDSITVQLTPNGGFQQLYVEGITENKVYVKSQSDEPIDCFYLIQAERKDVGKMEVEY